MTQIAIFYGRTRALHKFLMVNERIFGQLFWVPRQWAELDFQPWRQCDDELLSFLIMQWIQLVLLVAFFSVSVDAW